jgi:hypothetical protein
MSTAELCQEENAPCLMRASKGSSCYAKAKRSTPEQFRTFIKSETDKRAKVVKAAGLKPGEVLSRAPQPRIAEVRVRRMSAIPSDFLLCRLWAAKIRID